MTKRAKLNDIIKCCEIRFNRGEVATWKHGDFIDLHREIQRDTRANISPNTLKRIFGKIAVDEDYVPQQATLDALKQYGRYTAPDINPTPEYQPELIPVVQSNAIGKKSNFKTLRILFFAVAAVIFVFITWHLFSQKDVPAKIKLTRTEGHLPATAFFELDLPKSDDSLFVNFGDKSPLTYVVPGEKNAAHIYFIPGVFNVSIQTRRQVIASTSTYIRSDSWIGLAFHRQDDIPNRFYQFPAVKTGKERLFQVTYNQLFTMGFDTTGVILTRLCNYTPVPQSADDFIFEATFKTPQQDKVNYCRSTQFHIAGGSSIIRFKFVSPGCSLRVLNVVSEQTFKGATDNLSQFVLELEKWNTVKLVNHNRHVLLYVNGKQIFSGKYQRSLGNIKGLFLEFEGAGSVKNCELKSYQGKTLYHF